MWVVFATWLLMVVIFWKIFLRKHTHTHKTKPRCVVDAFLVFLCAAESKLCCASIHCNRQYVLCSFRDFCHFCALTFTLLVSYSVCAAALWPSVALVVPSSKLGTAYGLMNAIQNFGLAVGSLAGGYLLTATNQDYHMLTYAMLKIS